MPNTHSHPTSYNFTHPTSIRNVGLQASPYMLNVQVSSHILPGRPFSRYESHYAVPIGRKKNKAVSEADEAIVNKVRSKHATRKVAARKADARVDPHLDEQFATGRLYGETMVAVTLCRWRRVGCTCDGCRIVVA